METKLNRIAAFIDSLPAESTLGEIHSTMLTTGFDEMGSGGANTSNCISNCGNCLNKENCEGLTNGGDCKNMEGGCAGSSNGGDCFNDKKLVNATTGCS